MSFVKPLNLLWLSLNAANDVQREGLVLALEAAGTVIPCVADGTPIGVAYMTTEDPLYNPSSINHSTQYALGMEIAIIREGLANVPYHIVGAGQNVTIGMLVSMLNANTSGYVTRHIATALPGVWAAATVEGCLEEMDSVVGIALEAKTVGKSGVAGATNMLVLLQIANVDYAS